MTALSSDDETTSAELAPRRMLDGGAGDAERRLIASARLDRVPHAAKARVAAALGAALELQAAPSEPPSAARAPLHRSGTRWALGVAGAGVVGALALSLWLRATPGESSNVVSSPAAAPFTSPTADSAKADSRAEPARQPELTEQAEPTPQSEPPRVEPSAPSPAKKKAVAADSEAVESGLLAEVRALEAVSAAIGAAQPDRAARALDAYHRRFPHGELAIEADVLAIQLAVARGDDGAASAGAERLLARPEAEHYRARVHALLASPDRENARGSRSNEPAPHMRARR